MGNLGLGHSMEAMQLADARQRRWEAEQANQRATEAARLQAALQAISIGGGSGGWANG